MDKVVHLRVELVVRQDLVERQEQAVRVDSPVHRGPVVRVAHPQAVRVEQVDSPAHLVQVDNKD